MRPKILRGRYVVTDPELLPGDGILESGGVVVESGRVVTAGTFTALKRDYPNAEVIGSDKHIVIPGLINSHHHGRGLSGLQLGVLDDPLETWLLDFLAQKPLDTYVDTLYSGMQLVRSGVTTVLHAGYVRGSGGLETETRDALRAYGRLGLRVAYAVGIEDRLGFVYDDNEGFLAGLPSNLAEQTRAALAVQPKAIDDYFDFVGELVAENAGEPLVKILYGPTWPIWCSEELLCRVADAAKENELGVHIHVLESSFEREFGRRRYGRSVPHKLADIGLLGPTTSIAHGTWLSEGDLQICADTGTSVCHNASSNLRLRNGIAPVAEMLHLGVNVSIGIDGYALNDDDDMLQEMRLVRALHGLPGERKLISCPSTSDVLRMGTSNGARSAGLDRTVGTLRKGSGADAVLIDFEALGTPYLSPDVTPVDALVYRAKAKDVDTVIIGGEIVLKDKEFVDVDERAIQQEVATSAAAKQPADRQAFVELTHAVRDAVKSFYETWDSQKDSRPYYIVNSKR